MCFGVTIIAPPDEKGTCNKCDEGQHVIEDGERLTKVFDVGGCDVHDSWGIGTKCNADEEYEAQDGTNHLQGCVGEDDVVLVLEGIAQEVDGYLEEEGTEDEDGEGIEELYSVRISDTV